MQKVLHLLRALHPVQALEAFLGARREWLLSALQMSTASGMDSADAASTRLAVIAAQVQVCSSCHLSQLMWKCSLEALACHGTTGLCGILGSWRPSMLWSPVMP